MKRLTELYHWIYEDLEKDGESIYYIKNPNNLGEYKKGVGMFIPKKMTKENQRLMIMFLAVGKRKGKEQLTYHMFMDQEEDKAIRDFLRHRTHTHDIRFQKWYWDTNWNDNTYEERENRNTEEQEKNWDKEWEEKK